MCIWLSLEVNCKLFVGRNINCLSNLENDTGNLWWQVLIELKKNLEDLLEINGKGLFKGLRVCKPETQVKTQSVLKKEEKLSSYTKQNILEKTQSCIFSLWVCLRWWSSKWLVVWIMNVRLSGYMNILFLILWVVRGLSSGLMDIQALRQD